MALSIDFLYNSQTSDMKVAIVYDRVNKWGGAERVLLSLRKVFPEAHLYTSLYDAKRASWASGFSKVFPSFLQKLPGFHGRHEYLAPLMPLAFESFNFTGYDLVISVTSEAAKGIIVRTPTKHLCYCLTPTRYLWSHEDLYFRNPFIKYLSIPAIKYLKGWDKVAANRPDLFVAISKNVQSRIQKYYKRDSVVLYPPVDVNMWINNEEKETKKTHFILISRLVPYKRVDLAIQTFNKLGFPLYIVGQGSEENKLRKMSKKNIKFLGQLKDEDIKECYRTSKALIFPQDEDFGLVSLEAQASGIPVIAYKKGGALETIIEGETGIFFNKQTVDELSKAVLSLDNKVFNKNKLVNNARRFSRENFESGLKNLIAKLVV